VKKKTDAEILGADPITESIVRSTLDKVISSDLLAIFERSCPNCSWKIPSFRLEDSLACVECIPENVAREYYNTDSANPQVRLGEILENLNELRRFKKSYRIEK